MSVQTAKPEVMKTYAITVAAYNSLPAKHRRTVNGKQQVWVNGCEWRLVTWRK